MDNYFKIERFEINGEEAIFYVSLLREFAGYAGHFPGNPVAPGVCNIQMFKECAEQIAGRRLMINYISRCRFMAVVTPKETPRLQVIMHLKAVGEDGGYEMQATVAGIGATDATTDSEKSKVYIEFKAQLR